MGFVSTDDVIHSREELEKKQLKRLQDTINLAQSNTLYKKRLIEIGMVGDDCVTGLNDLEDLPFTTRSEIKITYPEVLPRIKEEVLDNSGFIFYCEEGHTHIREDEYIIEIIDPKSGTVKPDGEEGELVITPIGWKRVSLLRYKTGIIGSICSKSCGCKREKRTISIAA